MPGQVYFDSGVSTSVVSSNLKRIMHFHGQKYEKVRCDVCLADGSSSVKDCLSTVCKIVIGGRALNLYFIILPEADSNRTLIGADFMEQAGIVLGQC